VSRLSRKCGSLDVSQTHGPPRPATGIAWRIRVTTSPPSMSLGNVGSLDVSQTYGPSRPATGIALTFFYCCYIIIPFSCIQDIRMHIYTLIFGRCLVRISVRLPAMTYGIPQSLQANSRLVHRLDQDNFFPHIFQFIFRLKSYH
jgi:hypothetical protein